MVTCACAQATSCQRNAVDVAAVLNCHYQASKYPLSILVVGVGDGPWELMEEVSVNETKRNENITNHSVDFTTLLILFFSV